MHAAPSSWGSNDYPMMGVHPAGYIGSAASWVLGQDTYEWSYPGFNLYSSSTTWDCQGYKQRLTAPLPLMPAPTCTGLYRLLCV